MEESFVTLIQDMVLKPDLASAGGLFWFSLVNELFALLPYVVMVSGQLVFLEAESFKAIAYQFLFFIALPAGVGGALGSLLLYGLAYWGGKPLINRYKRVFRFSWEDVERVNKYFKGVWYDDLVFLLIRSIPILPSLPINIAVGVLRMPALNYFVLTAIGFTIRMMVMFGFMWFGAEAVSFSQEAEFFVNLNK